MRKNNKIKAFEKNRWTNITLSWETSRNESRANLEERTTQFAIGNSNGYTWYIYGQLRNK